MAVSRRDFIRTGVGSACTLAAGVAELQAQDGAALVSPACTRPSQRHAGRSNAGNSRRQDDAGAEESR